MDNVDRVDDVGMINCKLVRSGWYFGVFSFRLQPFSVVLQLSAMKLSRLSTSRFGKHSTDNFKIIRIPDT